MKKNNKGFMLVEVIISTVVVATVMTSLYVAFNKVYNYYELKESYTNVDAIYAIKTIEDYLIDFKEKAGNEFPYKSINVYDFNSLLNELSGIKEIKKTDSDVISDIFDEYKINKMYLIKVKGDGSPININDFSEENETFKEYIKYLNDAVIDLNQGKETYWFIVETAKGLSSTEEQKSLNKYAYLEVK